MTSFLDFFGSKGANSIYVDLEMEEVNPTVNDSRLCD